MVINASRPHPNALYLFKLLVGLSVEGFEKSFKMSPGVASISNTNFIFSTYGQVYWN